MLSQEAYNIFDKKIITTKKDKETSCTGDIKAEISDKHPILRNIIDADGAKTGKINLGPYHLCQSCGFFPKASSNENLQAGMSADKNIKLYLGWFEKYSCKWDFFSIKCEPLIYADDKCKKPIMLCYPQYNIKTKTMGAYIITTMYVGSSFNEQLIKNLFGLVKDNSLLKKYYEDHKPENQKKAKSIGTFLLLFYGIYLFFNHFYSDLNPTYINMVLSGVIIVLVKEVLDISKQKFKLK